MKSQKIELFQAIRIAGFCFLMGLLTMSFKLSVETTCPTANFSVSNNGCTGPCTISFTNSSINATSYHWDFDDGNTSTEMNPQHIFQEAGTYNVELRAIIDGCEHSFIGIVDIATG